MLTQLMKRLAALVLLSAVTSTGAQELQTHNYSPRGGYVPDAETAIRIAVAVWEPIYGKAQIEKEKPYHSSIKDGIWTVLGSLPTAWRGGVAEAEISKKDGQILRISHGR
ncbi:MAG: YbbC/YhhH family protein [Verrucomicrobia bacterium]|nr:YbbC/YhhH family protein [Verrucomicrobiota bacterium]